MVRLDHTALFAGIEALSHLPGIIVYKNGKKQFFSSTKYMLKAYYKDEQNISKIYTADFASSRLMDAKKGYFVFGSNLLSLAGDDLIAFDSEEKANIFSKKHNGKKIMKFEKVSKRLVDYLDMK